MVTAEKKASEHHIAFWSLMLQANMWQYLEGAFNRASMVSRVVSNVLVYLVIVAVSYILLSYLSCLTGPLCVEGSIACLRTNRVGIPNAAVMHLHVRSPNNEYEVGQPGGKFED
jgi:hypothetical protein